MADEKTTRLLKDGSVAEDVLVNPKHLERMALQAAEKERADAEASEPWSREKVERTIARATSEGVLGIVNGQEVKADINLNGADLSGLDLSGLDLSRANLHGARLVGAKLTGCRLVNANLNEADLSGAEMDDVNAVEANFHGACLCGSKVAKTHFMKANLSECCHEDVDGLDIEEKPLTPAEDKKARSFVGMFKRLFGSDDEVISGGARASISTEDGKVRYYGETLSGANVHRMKPICKRRR